MEEITALLAEIEFWPIAMSALRVLLILLGSWIAVRIANRLIRGLRVRIAGVMKKRAGGSPQELDKRAETVGGIIRKTTSVVIYGLAIVMAVREAGFDIGPILAGAGVLGLAVGFGAQNLVRDVMSGLFMLIENQIRVNDVAVINGTGGLVEEINLRTTVLRSLDGTVHVFPNGAITSLSNMTREYSFYVFETGVAYKEDTDRVAGVLKEIADGLMQDEPYRSAILAPLEILGVDRFDDSAVIIKSRLKTAPIQQWMVGREMNRRIKKKFDEVGIEIPFPHRSIYFGEASRPFLIDNDGDREALKAIVREVLRELDSRGGAGDDGGRTG
jgi:small conductance mechanosensitive channel